MREEASPSSAPGHVRPGAMTTAMRAAGAAVWTDGAPRVLRVAIARAGRIEREWTLERGTVTYGTSEDCDVFVAGAGHARRTLFEVTGGAITLTIPGDASGRLQLDEGPRDLAPLGGTSLVLPASARGRVVIAGQGEGATAVLFQQVRAPEARLRPELPASVRGGLLDRVDWRFTAIAAGSFMLHLAVVVGLAQSDWPLPPSVAEIDPRVAEIVFEDVPMPDLDRDDTAPSDPADETSDPSDESSPSDDAPTTTPHAPRTPHAPTTVAHADPSVSVDAAVSTAVQTLIGATGDPDGAFADLLRTGGPTVDQASVLAQVDAVGVATAPSTMHERDHSVGVPSTSFGPRTSAVGPIDEHGAPITEVAPRVPGHVHVEPIVDPVDPTVFDDAELRRLLRSRMSAIGQCYEHEITRTPGLEGRMTLSMQVERAGILSHLEITEDTVGSDALGACAIRAVSSIHLRVGPSEPITVEYPLVFAQQD